MFVIAVGRVLSLILGIFTLKVSTSILSSQEFGHYTLINTTVTFFILYLISPVGHYMNRQIHNWEQTQKLINSLNKYFIYLFAASAFSAALLFFDKKVLEFLPIEINSYPVTFWIVVGIFATTLNQTIIPTLNMLGLRINFLILTNLTALTALAISWFVVQKTTATAVHWFQGIVIANLLLAVVAYIVLRTKIKGSVETSFNFYQAKEVLKFSWPLVVVTGVGWLQFSGYRFYIEKYIGLSELGYFAAGYSVAAGILASVESVLNTYLLPKFYKQINTSQQLNQRQTDPWLEFIQWLLFPILSTGALLYFGTDFLVKIFLADQYSHVGHYVQVAVCFEILRVLTSSFQLIGHAEKNNRKLILPGIISVALMYGGLVLSVQEITMNKIFLAIGVGLGVHLVYMCVVYQQLLKKISIKNYFQQGLALFIFVLAGLVLTPENTGFNTTVYFLICSAIYFMLNFYRLRHVLWEIKV